ncbi:MAG: hypothetical protein ACR2PE_04620 [Porticoccus sp.]
MSALRNIIWLTLTSISVILGACLVMDNQDLIFYKIFDFESKLLPKGLWFLISFCLGCLVTMTLTSTVMIAQKFKLNSVKKQLAKFESAAKNKELKL